MNKRFTGTVLAGLTLLGFAGPANAAFIDRGNGLIYDDVLNITWLQDGNYAATQFVETGGAQGYEHGLMVWDDAMVWADGLEYGGYDDWRLPTLAPINGTSFQTGSSNNATTNLGFARTTTDGTDGGWRVGELASWRDGAGNTVSEMGHWYYVSLGNLGLCISNDADPGSCPVGGSQPGWGFHKTSFFSNFQLTYYWNDVEYAPDTNKAWVFNNRTGGQVLRDKGIEYLA